MKKLPSEEQIWKKYYLQDKSNNNKMEFKEHGCNSKLRVVMDNVNVVQQLQLKHKIWIQLLEVLVYLYLVLK